MLKIGYQAVHERYQPLPLLDYAVEAEKAGFDSIWSSDHFHPWGHTNASGGFSWVWMTALAERTRRVEIGTGVMCPTIRYHPAIVAQAFATLANMYPGRIFMGLGSGEAMNEVPLGYRWPPFKERAERLEEAIRVMKLLWSRDFVTFRGRYYTLKKANLYTKPRSPIPIYVAATGPTVAEIAGRQADGFLTTGLAEHQYRDVLLPAMEKGAKSAGRNPDDIIRSMEVPVSFDEDYGKALDSVRFWAGALMPVFFMYGISDPRMIEEHGKLVGDRQLAEYWLIGTKPDDHIKRLEKYIKMGFQHLYVSSSSPDEIKTARMYGKHVLPYIRSTYGK